MENLTRAVMAGDPVALARAISLVEEGAPRGERILAEVFRGTGRASIIGVTGPPGAGKSSLVNRLVTQYRSRGDRLGVVAIDPSSAFSGGAILGDRIRMQQHTLDPDVFIRSMATRGRFGGLSRATRDAVDLMDAAGRDPILIETVGVGQDEVDIVRTADISVVVLVPGTGDEVQALKAGIMEIADIFVVNKADREGADRLVAAVDANLALHPYQSGEWRPPVVKTVATTGAGVAELVAAIDQFRAHAAETQMARRKTRGESRLRELVSQRFMDHLERRVLRPGELAQMVERIAAREVDPYTAASDLLQRALGMRDQPRNHEITK